MGKLAGGHWKYAERIGTEDTIRPAGLSSGVGSGLMGQTVGPGSENRSRVQAAAREQT